MRRLTAFTLLAASFSAQVHAQIAPLVTVHSDEKPAYVSPFDKKEPTPASQTLRLPGYVPLIESPIKAEAPVAKPVQRQLHINPARMVKSPKVVVRQAQPASKAAVADTRTDEPAPRDVILAAPAAVVTKVSLPEVQSHTPLATTGITMPEARHVPIQQQATTVQSPTAVIVQPPQVARVEVGTPVEVVPAVQDPSVEMAVVAQTPLPHNSARESFQPTSEPLDWPASIRKMIEPWLSVYVLAFAGLAVLCAAGFMLRTRIAKMWTNRDPAMHDPWFSK